MLLGLGVSVLNTRLLGPQQFGDLRFLQSLFTVSATILTFGVFISGSTLLAQKKNEMIKRELLGNLILFALFISIVLAIGLYSFSFFQDSIFHNNLGVVIRTLSPLVMVYPFKLCIEKSLVGDNRVYMLSILNTVPSAIYLIGAFSVNYISPLSVTSSLVIQLAALGALVSLCILILKPTFINAKRNLLSIWTQNMIYGYHVYIGVLTGVGTNHLAGLLIAYYVDNTNVGFYSLAITVTMPLAMVADAVGTTYFKHFTNLPAIPRRLTLVTILLSVSSLIVFLLIVDRVVIFAFSEKYSASIPIAYIVSLGSVAHGFGDYFNRFLGSHGKGKAMRNGSIVVGISNVLGFMILVRYFGVLGAAVANTFSSFVYLAVRYYPYHKSTRDINALCKMELG